MSTQTGTLRVEFDGGRPPAVITPRIADNVAYSTTWRKRGWPSAQEDQHLATIFIAFAACRRTGQFSGSFEEFTEQALSIEPVGDDTPNPASDGSAPAEPAPADPTSAGTAQTVPAPGTAQGSIDPTPAPLLAPEPQTIQTAPPQY